MELIFAIIRLTTVYYGSFPVPPLGVVEGVQIVVT